MKKRVLSIAIFAPLFIGLNVSCSIFSSEDASNKYVPVKSGAPPAAALQLQAEPPISVSDSVRIRQLIDSLADIDKPDFSLSATLEGYAFAPVSSMRTVQSGIIMHHVIETAPALLELVKLGPRSLPFLLDSLDDETPTKLVISHDGFFGGMRFANELSGNLANTKEQAILAWAPQTNGWSPHSLTNYTVTVGDVCFVIIGQIVGRQYEAVRYQPTANVVINSPAHDPMMAKQVRAIWSGQDCRRTLYESLLSDYSTEGIFNGSSLDGWDAGSQLQCESALRLLYYFPATTTNLITRRLDALDVRRDVTSDDYMMRSVSNGVRAEDFLEHRVWTTEPTVKAAIGRIFERTDNANLLAVSLKALDASQEDFVVKRVEKFFAKNGKFDEGPYVDGYRILVNLGQKFGAKAKPAFEAYMRNATVEQRYSMTQVLRETQGQWSIELLSPLLSDRNRADHEQYGICCDAAETIALNFPKLSFQATNDLKSMDSQIAIMRQRIASGNFQ